MATFRKIHTMFWSDPFIQSLSPEKKYFYLYLLTNEKTKQCGIYEITKKHISYDTGYNIDTVSILLKYFIDTLKIAYSERTSELAIKNWNKYNENRSPKTQVLIKQELASVKEKSLIQYQYNKDTIPILHTQKEREEEEEEVKEKEKERESEISQNLIFDIEEFLIKNRAQFEVVCMSSQKSEKEVLPVLKKFHLWNQEKENYPKKPQALIAGLKKWLIDEKKFNSNGIYSGNNGKARHTTIKRPGGFGEL